MKAKNKLCLGIICFLWSKSLIAQQPEVFVPELTTDKTEYGLTMTPDGQTIYFVQTDSFYVSKPKNIYKSEWVNGKWTKPKMATFSGTDSDASPFVSPDGKKLFFTSRRPVDGKMPESGNIWYVELQNGHASTPQYLEGANSSKSEYSPSTDLAGNLYFGSYRDGGEGWGDIWMSKLVDSTYQTPVNLGPEINTEQGEWGSCIAPSGGYLIFENSGRDQNLSPAGDLYISFFENGKWTSPFHFNTPINSIGSDLTPKIIRDYLYFASNRAKDKGSTMNLNDVDFYRIGVKDLIQLAKGK